MIIEILETFLDGRNKYAAGEVREVSHKDAEYFCKCGWARDTTGSIETAPRMENGKTILDIRGSNHEQTAEKV